MSSAYREINLSYLESIADGDQGIINELIIIFLDQVPEFTDGFRENFSNKNWKNLAALAHKAKSSVLSVGMAELGNVDLKNLELIAKSFRIIELEKSGHLEIKEQDELKSLLKTLTNYPDNKKRWIKENSNEETMNAIIERFVSTCDIACNELKTVLEN